MILGPAPVFMPMLPPIAGWANAGRNPGAKAQSSSSNRPPTPRVRPIAHGSWRRRSRIDSPPYVLLRRADLHPLAARLGPRRDGRKEIDPTIGIPSLEKFQGPLLMYLGHLDQLRMPLTMRLQGQSTSNLPVQLLCSFDAEVHRTTPSFGWDKVATADSGRRKPRHGHETILVI